MGVEYIPVKREELSRGDLLKLQVLPMPPNDALFNTFFVPVQVHIIGGSSVTVIPTVGDTLYLHLPIGPDGSVSLFRTRYY